MMKRLEQREARETDVCEQEMLRREIREVRQRLRCIDSCFNMTDDGELLDSIICQRGGLMAHYGYLLRKAKAMCQQTENAKAASGAVAP